MVLLSTLFVVCVLMILFSLISIITNNRLKIVSLFLFRMLPGILYDACVLTGNKLGERICPSWKDDVQRIIFKGPGKSLKQAYFLASHSQWNQAAVIWNELSNSPNKNQAYRASFNLALTWERDDDLEQAKEWTLYADSISSTQKNNGIPENTGAKDPI